MITSIPSARISVKPSAAGAWKNTSMNTTSGSWSRCAETTEAVSPRRAWVARAASAAAATSSRPASGDHSVTAGGEERVRGGGDTEQRDGGAHGGAGPDAAEDQQDQSEGGVGGEDVAGEQHDGVDHPQEEQSGQTPKEPRDEPRPGAVGGGELQGEGIAEEEGEQQEELRLEERRHHRTHGTIERAADAGVRHAGAVVGGGQVGDVHHQDAEQGESPQRVDGPETPDGRLLHGSRVGRAGHARPSPEPSSRSSRA
ncbi:hypothetical protein AB0M38_17040 [Streptomyces sp. NPDC051742]|uniref:hypothetical protein n=1 Tax=unclassified Streptomyces TaxID=2593676 RepID=UPI00341C571F